MSDNELDLDESFEFNDGVGDALKEKEKYTFSWYKTLSVLFIGLFFVILVTFGILEIGKKVFNVTKESQIIQDQIVDIIEEEDYNNKLQVDKEDIPLSKDHEDNNVVDSNVELDENKPLLKEDKPVELKTPQAQTKVKKHNIIMYRIIAGSFAKYSNAKRELLRIKSNGYDGYIWEDKAGSESVYKIQVGAFKSYEAANKLVNLLKLKEVDAYILSK